MTTIVVTQNVTPFTATSPAHPGLVGYGATQQEAVDNLTERIQLAEAIPAPPQPPPPVIVDVEIPPLVFTQSQLEALTFSQLAAYISARGITISDTDGTLTKADLVAAILAYQGTL